ncbi:MAG: nucleotidyltransferase [Methanomassiliicoccaceae archaeon]|nr:nucleotidyltransferase [Methanomassiliicoccaceae archaeon]
MARDFTEKDWIIETMARLLDVKPQIYKKAESVKSGLTNFLKNHNIEVYAQGSYEIGTMVKPCIKDKDGDFDIDLVALFPDKKSAVSAKDIKEKLGKHLKNQNYANNLGKEGKRCWTLHFELPINNIERAVFHIDVLPCVNDPSPHFELGETAVAITNKEGNNSYSWRSSNPRGYAKWFTGINSKYKEYREKDRVRIQKENPDLFKSHSDVSDAYTRTPMQMVIQILKRHRDMMFIGTEGEDNKPRSILITTLVAKIIEENNKVVNSTYDLLNFILDGLVFYSGLDSKNYDQDSAEYRGKKLIQKKNGKWCIKNPADPLENLAEKWNEHPQMATEFFRWVKKARSDLIDILDGTPEEINKEIEKSMGKDVADELFNKMNSGKSPTPKPLTVNDKTPKPYLE